MGLLHAPASAWNRKTVLFVHGIGFQSLAYSEPLYKILRAEDPATADATNWHEIAYDEASTLLKAKVAELERFLPKPGAAPGAMDASVDLLVDLVNYLVTTSLYHWTNTFARQALLQAIQQGIQAGVMPADHQIFLIAHSLGTVVSYEVLHRIVDDPQVPGLSSGVRVKTWMTMGSPLAFIKARQKLIPSLNDQFFLRKQPIGRPKIHNPFTEQDESNVTDWLNFRHTLDPVGSLVPLDLAASNNSLTRESFIFDAFHAGLNPHDFSNYITEFKSTIMDQLRA